MSYFLETAVAAQIVDLCRWISEGSKAEINMSMSLTRDLSFDSMKLMQFFAGIEDLYPGVALEDWFIENSSGGRDTIESVVQHLTRIVTPIAAE
jgi:acyl carrier protein